MVKQFDLPYDPHLSLELAIVYQESEDKDNELLNELLLQVSPLVGIVSRTHLIVSMINDDINVLRCEALESVYHKFYGGWVPTNSVKTFTAFLFTVIKRSLIDSIRRSSSQQFDCWKLCDDPTPTYGSGGVKEVESKLWTSQIKDLIKSILHHDIRHTGKDKDACEYIALCSLGFLPHDPMSVKFKYRLSAARAKYLSKYTEILVKDITYTLKDLDENC